MTPDEANQKIGANFRAGRLALKLSCAEVSRRARELGAVVSPRRVRRMEDGVSTIYGYDLYIMGRVLELSTAQMLEGVD